MIDLTKTRAEFLAAIEAPSAASLPLTDLADPRVAHTDALVRLRGNTRGDLFPLLKLALAERFAALPRLQLIRDLLMPLRNALGNAYKHGNGRDSTKTVSVEMVLTSRGALIAVTDEGPGFDAAQTLRRFQEQQPYFVSQGFGFRNLHEARSVASYEHSGRTLLLCFRPASESDQLSRSPAATADSPTSRGRVPALSRPVPSALDGGWIRTCLSAEMPEFRDGRARLESCRIYPTAGSAGDYSDESVGRYVLRVIAPDRRLTHTRILTGWLHPSERAAEVDFEVVSRLHQARISKSILIPRPVWRPAREPRLVLYEFDPWMSLGEYLVHQRSVAALQHSGARIARALGRLQRSQVALPRATADLATEGLQAMVARAKANLRALPSGADLAARLGACVQRIQEHATVRRQRIPAIRGTLAWDRIHYGVDGRFYVHPLEWCRSSEVELDLGGFAADMLCFTLTYHDVDVYRSCLDVLLGAYNSKAEHPMDAEDLRNYLAVAICERLARAEPRTDIDARHLLRALNTALQDRG